MPQTESFSRRNPGPLAVGCWLMTMLLASAAAQSTSPPAPSRPDPADARAAVPKAQVPALRYREPPPPNEEPGRWRAANDRVNAIGGWRVYLREGPTAQGAAAAASAPAAGLPSAAPPPATPAPAQRAVPTAPAPAAGGHRH